MAKSYRSTFTASNWNEMDVDGAPGTLRRTTVHHSVTYIGEVAGTSQVSYLMVYKSDQTVDYVGYEAFEGTIGRHNGSVVFENRGTFESEGATIDMSVVPGTATGDLAGITLTGKAFAPSGSDGSILLVEEIEVPQG